MALILHFLGASLSPGHAGCCVASCQLFKLLLHSPEVSSWKVTDEVAPATTSSALVEQ